MALVDATIACWNPGGAVSIGVVVQCPVTVATTTSLTASVRMPPPVETRLTTGPVLLVLAHINSS